MDRNLVCRCGLIAVALITTVGAAQAASLFVANNGVDSGTCGSSASPCRSINQAIANGNDGDHIRVGPGRYSPDNEPVVPCDCLILVDKAVKIEAIEGAGGTVIDGDGSEQVVRIASNGVTFGLDHKGFTIVGGTFVGVLSLGNDHVQLHSNRVIGIECGDGYVLAGVDVLATYNEAHCNFMSGFRIPATFCHVLDAQHVGGDLKPKPICKTFPTYSPKCADPNGLSVQFLGNQSIGNGDHGFHVDDGVVEFESNLASGNHFYGFFGRGDSLLYEFNAATGNGNSGFYAPPQSSSHLYDRNVASGNGQRGFELNGPGHTVMQNAVIGNSYVGIQVYGSGAVITKNNIFGNDPVGNCGVLNSSGAALSAIKNYWGVPGGPGANPADNVCGNPVTFSPWLPGPTAVPFTTGAGGSP